MRGISAEGQKSCTSSHTLYTGQQRLERIIKRDKKSFVDNPAEQAEQPAGQKDTKEQYCITRKQAGSRRSVEQAVKFNESQLLTIPNLQ